MRRRRRVWHGVLALLVTPLLVAATDPGGDVGPCPGMRGRVESAPDLIEATGEIVELGTSARFSLRFADPLIVPDREGTPFRVDIVLLDPAVPSVDARMYRGFNRLLRYDAVAAPVTSILLVPEAGESRFLAPTIEGPTLVMQVPGRTLTADEDETGTSPGLGRLRWSVIVRDERACDLLGNGRPTERLIDRGDGSSTLIDDGGRAGRSDHHPFLVGMVVMLVLFVVGAYLLGRPARNAR